MTPAPPTTDTVEALVRHQLGQALGGRRGMVEAAVPTLTFTVVWLVEPAPEPRARRQRRRGGRGADGPAGPAPDREVLRQRTGRHRDRLVLRAPRREPWWQRRRPGAGLLRAGTALQHRVRRADGADLHHRLAAGRLHDRQRHRRPDGVALRPAGRAAVHAADLAAPAAVRGAGRWSRGRSGWPATRGTSRPTPRSPRSACSKIAMGWPLQLAALGAMSWLLGRNHTPAPGGGAAVSSCAWSGLSRDSSSFSTSADTTNSSSSPASTGCSPSGG